MLLRSSKLTSMEKRRPLKQDLIFVCLQELEQQVGFPVLLVAFRTPLSPFASFRNYSFLFHIRFFDCLRRLHSKSLGQCL